MSILVLHVNKLEQMIGSIAISSVILLLDVVLQSTEDVSQEGISCRTGDKARSGDGGESQVGPEAAVESLRAVVEPGNR